MSEYVQIVKTSFYYPCNSVMQDQMNWHCFVVSRLGILCQKYPRKQARQDVLHDIKLPSSKPWVYDAPGMVIPWQMYTGTQQETCPT